MTKLEPTVMTDEVYRRIKHMIIKGELAPGARLDRKALAGSLGVSPTPLNEALARLIGERFLERHSGFYVPERPAMELAHLFAVRAGLEAVAALLCVEKALAGEGCDGMELLCGMFSSFEPPFDEAKTESYLLEDMAFHEGIIREAGNPVLSDIDGNLGCVHRSWIRGLVRPPEETLPEHRAIIAAFRARDSAEAQRLLMSHNLRSRDVLLLRKTADARSAARRPLLDANHHLE